MPTNDFQEELIKAGVQYYIAGRFAAVAWLNPVAGNLLHHAVEMCLKAQLAETRSPVQLKNYSHRLRDIWPDFKKGVPSSLNRFDQLISELDPFENIRYPDEIVKHGAHMAISWSKRKPAVTVVVEQGSPSPQYFLYPWEVDDLLKSVFELCEWNPAYFFGNIRQQAKESFAYENEHAAFFLAGAGKVGG